MLIDYNFNNQSKLIMNIESGENFISLLPDEVLLRILRDVEFDPRHQLLNLRFHDVLSNYLFDELLNAYKNSPFLTKVVKQVEENHPKYQSSFEEVRDIYQTLIDSTTKIKGGLEKNRKTREIYADALSLQRLDEIAHWQQEQEAANLIKIFERIAQSSPTWGILNNIKEKGQMEQADELRRWMGDNPEELKKIDHLYLESFGSRMPLHLTGIPKEIFKFTNLTSLFLGENELTTIPSEISKLTQLNTLSLHNNQLNELPPEIGELSHLEIIALQHNQLTKLPHELGKLTQLESLWLYDNQLKTLPPEMGNLAELKFFKISENPFTTIPQEIFTSSNPIISQNEEVLTIKNTMY